MKKETKKKPAAAAPTTTILTTKPIYIFQNDIPSTTIQLYLELFCVVPCAVCVD